jgi:hypothetical protein
MTRSIILFTTMSKDFILHLKTRAVTLPSAATMDRARSVSPRKARITAHTTVADILSTRPIRTPGCQEEKAPTFLPGILMF